MADKTYTKNELIAWMLSQSAGTKAAMVNYLQDQLQGRAGAYVDEGKAPQTHVAHFEAENGVAYTNLDHLVDKVLRNGELPGRHNSLFQEYKVVPAKEGDALPEGAAPQFENYRVAGYVIQGEADRKRVGDHLFAQFGEGRTKEEFNAWLQQPAEIPFTAQGIKSDGELTTVLNAYIQQEKRALPLLLNGLREDGTGKLSFKYPPMAPYIQSEYFKMQYPYNQEYRSIGSTKWEDGPANKPAVCYDMGAHEKDFYPVALVPAGVLGGVAGTAAGFGLHIVTNGDPYNNYDGLSEALPRAVSDKGMELGAEVDKKIVSPAITKIRELWHGYIVQDVCPTDDGKFPPAYTGSEKKPIVRD